MVLTDRLDPLHSDPVGGSVELDGSHLKDLNLKWLRTQIGLVSQEPTLFATTVAGNIEHGLIGTQFENESVEQKRARVVEAAVKANADGFITALPDGYDTMSVLHHSSTPELLLMLCTTHRIGVSLCIWTAKD